MYFRKILPRISDEEDSISEFSICEADEDSNVKENEPCEVTPVDTEGPDLGKQISPALSHPSEEEESCNLSHENSNESEVGPEVLRKSISPKTSNSVSEEANCSNSITNNGQGELETEKIANWNTM